MATSQILVRLQWENDVGFQMDAKRDTDDYITIVQMDENGHIGSLWTNAQSICETYFKEKLDLIGSEMKA